MLRTSDPTKDICGDADLTVPTITKEEELHAIEEHIEDEAAGLHELALEPVLAHCGLVW